MMEIDSEKKRIIMCTNVYPPHFIGGAELIVHYHAKILKSFGHDIIIFTGDANSSAERHSLQQDTYDGLTVYRVSLIHKDYSNDCINFSHRRIEEHLNALVDNFSPNIIHFHNIIGLSVGIVHIAKRRGIKTVLTAHDYWGFCYKNTLIKRENEICHDFNRCEECMPFIQNGDGKNIPFRMRKDFFAMQLREVDIFISPSQYLAETYIRAGFPRDRFRVIWNGIDIQRFAKVSKTKKNGVVRFTFIGHLGMHKGVHILLNACALLGEREQVKINIVGDGELMTALKQQAMALGLKDTVKFWGKIDNDRIEKVYRETDVLILPSIWPENQPVSITEAMAAKTPVIASRLGGIPELIEDGNLGYLFEAGNAQQLAQKMLEFILHSDRLQTFGDNAYKKIASNTFENQVNKILQVYNEKNSIHKGQLEGTLIVCAGKHMSPESAATMDAFLKENTKQIHRFVMSEWIGEDLLCNARLFWVVDKKIAYEDVIAGLRNKIPLLVPEDNAELRRLCSFANCGLYYSNVVEAKECLNYIIHNTATASAMGENGYRFLHVKNELLNRLSV